MAESRLFRAGAPRRAHSSDAWASSSRADSLEPLDAAAQLSAVEPVTDPSAVLQEVAEQTSYGEIFLNDLIRRQRRLSLSVAAVFFAVLIGLPALNSVGPMIMALPILGIPLTWLLLAVLIYPFLWLLAFHFTMTARAIEEEFVDLVR
jgi:uncharacterized membrane protein (DUF485 family)